MVGTSSGSGAASVSRNVGFKGESAWTATCCFLTIDPPPVLCLNARQMLPARPTPPLRRILKTPAWIRLPIRPLARPLSPPGGRLGLPRRRVTKQLWVDQWTPSCLLSVTPPLSVALTRKTSLPASGRLPRHAPPASPWIRTSPPGSRPSPRRPRHLGWSQCGAANTPPLRTRSSPPSRGPSRRKL